MVKLVETGTVVQDGANIRNRKLLKPICITISMSVSCMLLVISIPILIAHIKRTSADATHHESSTQSSPANLNQTVLFLIETSNSDVAWMPDDMEMPLDNPHQDQLKPITGPINMIKNIKTPPQNGSSCQCRSPFQPAHNCTLCFHIPIRSAFRGFTAPELYNKTSAIQECSVKLGGEIPHSKFRFSTGACLWVWFQQKSRWRFCKKRYPLT